MKISVIGLGAEKDQLTLQGLKAIKSADTIVVKTAVAETVKTLDENGIKYLSCDSFYDEAQDFSELNEKIFEYLKSLGGNVAFCVNGCGTDDSTVELIKERCGVKKENCEVEIFAGVSLGQNVLKFYPQSKWQTFSASALAAAVTLSINVPLVVTEIDDKLIAAAVKEKLNAFYDDEEEVLLFNCGKIYNIPLYELDRQKRYDERTSLLIRVKKLTDKKSFEVGDLKEILSVLRAENGCPWDKAQTHESLRANVIEEAYELVDAIDSGDVDNIVEETGDNLLQSYFHISLGEEDGEFNEKEVLTRLCGKLIFRHTHIFGNDKAGTSEEALKVWEKNKAIEKGTHTVTDTMRKVAKNLPSLTRAVKVQKRAAKNNFDWTDAEGLYDKLAEETAELKEAVKSANAVEIEKEAGDLLFQVVNICRFLGLEPEVTLNKGVGKFINRFEYMENRILETYENFADAPNGLMEKFWEEAKVKGL